MPASNDSFEAMEERLAAARQLRDRRQQIFARFERRQRSTRAWFPLGRIAWLYAEDQSRRSKLPGPLTSEDAAFQRMARGLLEGGLFTQSGDSMLLFLDPLGSRGARRLTTDYLDQLLELHPESVIWRQVIARCWTPRGYAEEAVADLGLVAPPSWFPTTEGAAEDAPTKVAPPAPPPQPRHYQAGRDFRPSDRLLAEEIVSGVLGAKSDWESCGELAHRAAGKGSLQTKQKRLSRIVKEVRRFPRAP